MNHDPEVFNVKFGPAGRGITGKVEVTYVDKADRTDKAAQNAPKGEIEPGAEFSKINGDFITNMEAFFVSMPFIMLMNEMRMFALVDRELREACEKNAMNRTKEQDGAETFTLKLSKIVTLRPIIEQIEVAGNTRSTLRQSFIIQESTQFDILVSAIISAVISKRPEILNTSERKLEYSELFSFTDMDQVKAHFVEKFVETIVRKGRREQISWFENVLKIPMTKDLPSWPSFIEINERRNLFTHTAGVVSTEYLVNCNAVGAKLEPEIKVGTQLSAPFEYYRRATDVFFEIGIKLIHVVWRKTRQDEIAAADLCAIRLSYNLLTNGRYQLAQELLRFFCDVLPKHTNDNNKRILVVNYANSLNLQGKEQEAKEILDRYDWTASDIKFRISVAAVRNEVSAVVSLMKGIGTSDQVTEAEFKEWPVFKKIRAEKQFLEAYREIFGHDIEESVTSTKVDLEHITQALGKWAATSVDPSLAEATLKRGKKEVSASVDSIAADLLPSDQIH